MMHPLRPTHRLEQGGRFLTRQPSRNERREHAPAAMERERRNAPSAQEMNLPVQREHIDRIAPFEMPSFDQGCTRTQFT